MSSMIFLLRTISMKRIELRWMEWRHNKFINILRLNDKKRYKEWDSMKSYSYLLLLAIKDDLIQFILSILNFKKD